MIPPLPLQARARTTVGNAPQTLAWIETVAHRLLEGVATTEGEIEGFSIYLDNGRSYDALAFFDHGITVNIGVLDRASSEDEIAFILAHELAHVLLGHTNNQKNINQSLGRLQLMQETLNYAGDLAETSVADTAELRSALTNNTEEQDSKELQESVKQHNQKTNKFVSDFRSLSEKVAKPAWTGKQEDEADTKAVELLLRAGYSFRGVIASLTNMQQSQDEECKALVTLNERAEEFGTSLEKMNWAKSISDDSQRQEWKDTLKPLRERSKIAWRKILLARVLPQTHRPWDERLKILLEFAQTPEIAPLNSQAKPRSAALERVKRSADYDRIAKSAVAIDEFSTAMNEQNLAQAAALLGQVDMKSAQGRLLKRDLRLAQGRNEDAFQNLVLAMKLPKPALQVMELYAAGELQRENYKSVEELTARAEELYHDPLHFLPEQVYLSSVTFPEAQRQKANIVQFEECRKAPRKELRKLCRAAKLASSPFFRDSAQDIIDAGPCSGVRCGKRLFGRLLQRPTLVEEAQQPEG